MNPDKQISESIQKGQTTYNAPKPKLTVVSDNTPVGSNDND